MINERRIAIVSLLPAWRWNDKRVQQPSGRAGAVDRSLSFEKHRLTRQTPALRQCGNGPRHLLRGGSFESLFLGEKDSRCRPIFLRSPHCPLAAQTLQGSYFNLIEILPLTHLRWCL